MIKFLTAAPIFASAASTVILISCPVAAAQPTPNSSGQTYADAKEQLEQAGLTVIVSTTVGDKLPWAECLVVHQQLRPGALAGKKNEIDRTKVLVSLGCSPERPSPR